LSGRCLQQQSFQKSIKPFIWNFIIDNNLDKCELRRNTIALPMDNYQSPPPPVSTATSVAAAITSLLMGHKKHKLNDIDPSVTLLDDDYVETLYPHLSCTLGGGRRWV
jgi:hypothetical protein